MSDVPAGPMPAPRRRWRLTDLAASPRFQSWASRVPGLRRLARAEGAALFDIVAGFVHAQVLLALVELRVLSLLSDGPRHAAELAPVTGVPVARLEVLLQAGAALGLLKRRRSGAFTTTTRGAALLGVPGLVEMIRHHPVLYRDLADPVAFFRDGSATELAGFWPYVFGGGVPPEQVAVYSDLMADSQGLVAEETLRHVSLRKVRHLMDVGGGTGAFLAAVARAYPEAALTLLDLPEVLAGAEARLEAAGLSGRVQQIGASFRDTPLPRGADAISLVRVLYDHADETVAALLGNVRHALPPGGRVIISEPMSGGARPDRATDTYFAVYTMAMGTGRTRSAAEIAAHLERAGFVGVVARATHRSFVTSVVEARVPV